MATGAFSRQRLASSSLDADVLASAIFSVSKAIQMPSIRGSTILEFQNSPGSSRPAGPKGQTGATGQTGPTGQTVQPAKQVW